MNILQQIAKYKVKEVALRRKLAPLARLEKSPLFAQPCHSLSAELLKRPGGGIIAEFKRRSPSKGEINPTAKPEKVGPGYVRAGAAALSILTDEPSFGGSTADLEKARQLCAVPILRKDFIIDPYQVIESKSMGADVILLIASILTPQSTLELATLARSLGMETLLEIHDRIELVHLNDQISLVGVNNRNLKSFSVSLETSLELFSFLPKGITAIAESGIGNPSDLKMLRRAGYRGFLIGESFMREADPAKACHDFILQIDSTL